MRPLLAVLLSSCSPADDCQLEAGGLCLLGAPIPDAGSVVTVVDAVGAVLGVDMASISRDNGVTVTTTENVIAGGCREYRLGRGVWLCDSHDGGVNYDGVDILIRHNQCLRYTSLAHELLHTYDALVVGHTVDGGEHSTPGLFGDGAEHSVAVVLGGAVMSGCP